MKRILEPELMDDVAQARAYAQADFAEENQGFVDRFREYFPDWTGGHVVDLGCGPGDIPIRFLRAFPDARVTGVDASRPMLDLAAAAVAEAGLAGNMILLLRAVSIVQLAGTSRCGAVQQFVAPCAESAAVLVSPEAMDEAGCLYPGDGFVAAGIS